MLLCCEEQRVDGFFSILMNYDEVRAQSGARGAITAANIALVVSHLYSEGGEGREAGQDTFPSIVFVLSLK